MGDACYQIVVMQDRYNGAYSGGIWLAISGASELVDATTARAQFGLVADDGPSGSDFEACGFWGDPPEWIAAGATTDEAMRSLESVTREHPVRANVQYKEI